MGLSCFALVIHSSRLNGLKVKLAEINKDPDIMPVEKLAESISFADEHK
jgi:hypothetical protein